jgi:acyl-CoA reductase-like NAD-dependent aldehyde dehydrogenase
MTNQVIPDEAVEAAAKALGDRFFWNGPLLPEVAREVLEAAAPHLLSHEREQTRLAHLDAVVNAESLSKYEEAIQHLRDLADNAERDRDYVKAVDAAAIHAAIDDALRDPHTAKPNNWV